jgi:uncharacterized protein YegP (UPF0339 family)
MYRIVRRLVLPLALAAAVGAVGLDQAAGQDKKDKKPAATAAQDKKDKKPAAAVAVFELYKDRQDEYRFRLKDDDDVLLAISGKGYKTKADCLKVIDVIKSTAGKAKIEELPTK